ncbi:MAG: ribbon-helix-helix protein, CopG family [Syntrophorhabdaceae bacterium]|nr:ribbon-helix-helix protein, CopG family [Syntrophorhabdaceae bacterium]MDD5243481.1 ribbon-helix-helix protein, CopG family [Syntrophorhabdaceae bacterium]
MGKQMIIRIDPELKSMADNLARAEGKTVSKVVRELLEDYVRNRDISSYIDDLWGRIRTKMARKGVSLRTINATIKKVRAGR